MAKFLNPYHSKNEKGPKIENQIHTRKKFFGRGLETRTAYPYDDLTMNPYRKATSKWILDFGPRTLDFLNKIFYSKKD